MSNGPSRYKVALILFATLSVSCAHAQSGAGTLDHVRILVRDIGACDDAYRRLGFGLDEQPSVYLEGSAHNSAYLPGDDSAIELIGVQDRQKLLAIRPWIVDFIHEHQGAHSVGFLVPSAKTKSNDLAKIGIDAPVFDLIRSKPGAKPVELVTPKLSSLSEGSIFFLQYPPAVGPSENSPPNSNTAVGLLGAWIGVKNLMEAREDAVKLGFSTGRSLKSPTLGARGLEMESARGNVILLEAVGPGPTSEFIRERGAGILGLSVAVDDIAKAKSLMERATNRQFVEQRGFYGASFLIPPDLTCGVWMEIVQHR